jgi:ribosomal protein L11 methylase PrmA
LQATLTPWKAKFIRDFGFVVQSGPFAGMTFHSSAAADAYLPLLTGGYEAETHGFIESALARQPTVIIDVGCEAGYVAVGLALRAPSATVFGFDIDASARAKSKALASLNHVADRVIVESECTPQRLNDLCVGRPLVFCDCEGYEVELLDPEKAPHLKTADIIVELHDFMRTDIDITPTILSRFAATHDIAIAGVTGRSPGDYACLAEFPEQARAQALHEDRISYQQWAFLRAKAR